MTQNSTAHVHTFNVLHINASLPSCQPLTAMPECSQSARRQRPDYLAGFTSGSSADNSCSSSDEEEEERKKAGGEREGEKKEKKVSYNLGENKESDRAERSGETTLFVFVFIFLRLTLRMWSHF